MTQIRNFILNNEVPDLASPPTRTPAPHPHRPTYRTTGAIWRPKKPQGAPGARNAQVAKWSVIEKYHFGDRPLKPDFEGSSPGGRMERPKLTTVLQFGQWAHQKVTTVPQIHESFLGMSCTTHLQIRKVDRRCESRCADTLAKGMGGQGVNCKVRQDIIQKVGSKVRKTL